jgi:hypothetical protein
MRNLAKRLKQRVEHLGLPILISLGALVLSGGALAVSVKSCAQSADVESEQRDVRVHFGATTNPFLLKPGTGLPVTVSFANESLRSVIVRSASLWHQGDYLGPVTGYSAVGASRDDSGVPPNLTPLPLTMSAREGRSLDLFIDDGGALQGICSAPALQNVPLPPTTRHHCKRWRAAFRRGNRQLQLRLRLVPGGESRVPVQMNLDSDIIQDDAQGAWNPRRIIAIYPGGGTRVTLGLDLATGERVAAIASVDIWRLGDRRFHLAYKRPIIGSSMAGLRLPPLHRGKYAYAFRVTGRVVATGCFRLPPAPPAASDSDRRCG